VRWNKKPSIKSDKTETTRTPKRGVVGYSRKSALLEEAITQMNAGKYGRSSAALKELLALDPVNMEARRLFATLHLRLGSLIPAKEAFDALIAEAFQRQDYWLAESLLREYLAAGPRCVPYLEKLGTIYQEKGNVLEAVEEYGKAIDILIEDPDPEQPDHAGRLYAKIRELAPASPVAFRLASFFDAETGQFVPRQPSTPETDAALYHDTLEEDSRDLLAPSRTEGVMPWDVQVPSGGGESSAQASLPAEIVQPVTQSESPAISLPQTPASHQEPILSAEGPADQAEPISLEAQPDGRAALSIQETGEVPAAEEIHRLVEQELVKDSLPAPISGDSKTDVPVLPIEANSGAAAESSVTFQVSEQGSTETQTAPSIFEDRTEPEAILADSEQTAEASITLSEQVAGPRQSTSLEPAEDPVSLSLKAGPSTSESIPVQNREPTSVKADEVKERQAEESSGPTDSPIVPAQVSTDAIAQPWKQPGFSWKSVFDTAWKLGEQSPATEASTSPAPTPPDERVAATPPVPFSQDWLVKDHVPEIPKQEGGREAIDEVTPKSPTAQMAWDQAQESVLSIPPVRTDAPITEAVEASVDQPQEPDRVPRACDNQLPSSPSITHPDPEPVGFSFAQDVPTGPSEDRHECAVETGAVPKADQGTVQVAESAPAFSFVKASQADEAVSPASPEPESQACIQHPGRGSVVDQQEVRGEFSEVAIEREQDRIGAVLEEVEQRPKADSQTHHSKPVENVLREQTETVQSFESAPIKPSETKSIVDETGVVPESRQASQALPQDIEPPEVVVNVQTQSPIPKPMPSQQPRMETDISPRVSGAHAATPGISAAPVIAEQQEVSRPMPEASAGREAVVESQGIRRAPETRSHVEEATQGRKSNGVLKGVGTAVTGFLRAGFSTTHAIVTTVVGLVVLLGVCVAVGLGALALTWMIMEEPPSPTFQSFTTTPQQTLSGTQRNGYTLLVGIDAPVGQDPFRAGVERQSAIGDSTTALGCFGTPEPETGDRSSASAGTMRGWVRGPDPIGQFRSHQDTIRGWSRQQHVALDRYRQWQTLPFEDWGYGQPVSPPCGAMVFAHQLYVADGFVQSPDVAIDRLETDMEMWRVVLSQARTLPVKTLALQAINDDIALASGLLAQSDFDAKHLGRITKVVRPLDQAELSLRWPMQSELVSAGKTYESQLQAARADSQAISSTVASVLPLPKQRRLNDYAKYYEVSYQATGEKQYGSLPKWKDHRRFPAAGLMDYLTNPIENLVGVAPLPAWDVYNGMIVDTDAHLRLASLQAWLRRGSSEGDLSSKIAKAGQNFYDPYTGLPMLVNQQKGLLYSVGHDGKDQDADPHVDVVVEIPVGYAMGQAKSSASSSKSR